MSNVKKIRAYGKLKNIATKRMTLNEDGTEKEMVFTLPMRQQGGKSYLYQFTVQATKCNI